MDWGRGSKAERNAAIMAAFDAGETKSSIGRLDGPVVGRLTWRFRADLTVVEESE